MDEEATEFYRTNRPATDAVAASLKEFSWQQPIVVDERDVIIVGHTRYKAAKKLGTTTVPVHVARGLTPERAKAYRIADNRTAAYSSWDDGKLALELAALQSAGYDLSATAFPEDELPRLLTTPPGEPLADPDDVWHLGPHRLLCGDATNPDHLVRLMAHERANLVLTDPPCAVLRRHRRQGRSRLRNQGRAPDILTISGTILPRATTGVTRAEEER